MNRKPRDITGETRLLAVLGHPVRHSLSPRIHNASFAALGLDFVYVALDVRLEGLREAVAGAAALGLRGFNATMPHKHALASLVDHPDEAVRVSGAANTVVIDDIEDGDPSGLSTLYGYNTDGSGMVAACRESGVRLSGARVLLLGAGGAASASALALIDAGVKSLDVSNRDPQRARALLERLRESGRSFEGEALRSEGVREAARESDLIVNTTPLGMRDGDELPIPPSLLNGDAALCDAVYRPGRETDLVRLARGRGLSTVPGERMLLHQGVEAQRLWTGSEPDVEAMDAALRNVPR